MTEQIIKNQGITGAERYLNLLAESSFLSLWSHPGLFTPQGKELSDLLVVCGNDVIVFSSKDCTYPNSGNQEQDWSRWFKNAVKASAKQLWGAERRLRSGSGLFVDAACAKPFQLDLPDPAKANIYLVSVSHQASQPCKELLGGSGSLMLRDDIQGFEAHTVPFTIGDLDPEKSFVHVLDDTSLDILMKNLDTVSDFTAYLKKREALIRSEIKVFSAGEEEMLGSYLRNVNKQEEHDFEIPKDTNGVAYLEGVWDEFQKNPQRKAQKEEDRISYSWDSLIETFAKHAVDGTEYFERQELGSNMNVEQVLRFMAQESRFERRILSKALIGAIERRSSNGKERFLRCIPPYKKGKPYYVFLLFPWRDDKSEKVNRLARANFLQNSMFVVKAMYPDAQHIVGIATELERHLAGGSEDACYLNVTKWTEEDQKEALELQKKLRIFVKPERVLTHEREYPDVIPSSKEVIKNPRNKPCACGSGKKYKKCHGK